MRAAVPPDTLIEHFIHGALCVAFSGQCYISHAQTGRSANRGDCSQACRLPYTLEDGQGRVVAFDKHLLSLKDNNQSANLEALIDAGVQSFKIEGRYKDADYVKNITGHYRLLLDQIIDRRPDLARASSGRTRLLFTPNPDKTFHRGSTDYFATGRKADIGAFDSPAFVGLPLGTVTRVGPDWFESERRRAHGQRRRPHLSQQTQRGGAPGQPRRAGRRRLLAGLAQRAHRRPAGAPPRHRHQPQPRPRLGTGPGSDLGRAAHPRQRPLRRNRGGFRLDPDATPTAVRHPPS